MTNVSELPTLRYQGAILVNLEVAVRQLTEALEKCVGVPAISWHILKALEARDGQHASELARRVGRAATSFTPNLDKLEAAGLVTRKADKTDRRAVRIYLTEAGANFVADHPQEVDEYTDVALRNILADDWDGFVRVLTALQDIE